MEMQATRAEMHREKIQRIFQKPSHDPLTLCPLRDILHNMGDKWALQCMLQLGEAGTLRFSELKREIDGISQKMLTVTLRNLESLGMLTRMVYAEVPPKVEYTITERGRNYLDHMLGVVEWAFIESPLISAERHLNGHTPYDAM